MKKRYFLLFEKASISDYENKLYKEKSRIIISRV